MWNIPTSYAGIDFRSRLEAKWAATFDRLGMAWEYEPVDMPGWIPDFRVNGILIEVKSKNEEVADHVHKPCAAFDQAAPHLPLVGYGLIQDRVDREIGKVGLYLDRRFGRWSPVCQLLIHTCHRCRKHSMVRLEAFRSPGVGGHERFDMHCWCFGCQSSIQFDESTIPDITAAWKEATNAVQWQPSGAR